MSPSRRYRAYYFTDNQNWDADGDDDCGCDHHRDQNRIHLSELVVVGEHQCSRFQGNRPPARGGPVPPQTTVCGALIAEILDDPPRHRRYRTAPQLYGVTNPAILGRALVVIGHNSLEQMQCPARDRGSRSARQRIVPGAFGIGRFAVR